MRKILGLILISLLFLEGVLSQDKLNIWLVAHSHDDTGWLRTVDEYYIYEVQYILDSVVDALAKNPERKFIEVEMAFFSRWWREQNDERKQLVKELVQRGQLEFINGGWCMNDEAVATYYGMIDQMTLGHEFLQSAIGSSAKPTIGWHIDPFGHSNVVSTIYKLMGFDAFFINRIDYRLKDEMRVTKDLEFWWQGSKNLGEQSKMWIHMMDRHYCTPDGFDWEHGVTQNLPQGDGPPPMIIDPPSWNTPSNAFQRASDFVKEAKLRANEYKTNNILIPFGCDFTFQNANMVFKNMDKLIETINKYSEELGAVARYSTLSDFAESVKKINASWMTREEDFYPYADNGGSYWTGYFTSRPLLKSTSRHAHAVLRNSDFTFGLTRAIHGVNEEKIWDDLMLLRAPEAVVQHHDGVTGTFRQAVGENYMDLLEYGIEKGESVLAQSLSILVSDNQFDPKFSWDEDFLNSQLQNGLKVPVVVQNSLGSQLEEYIKVRLSSPNVIVTDHSGNQVKFQVNPSVNSDGYILYFFASIPAGGYSSFFFQPSGESLINQGVIKTVFENDVVIENEYISLTFDNTTGIMKKYLNKRLNQETKLTQDYWAYQSYSNPQSSGAYIFRPRGPASIVSATAQMTFIDGPYVQHIHQVFNQKIKQEVRIYKGLNNLDGNSYEIISTIGPLSYDEEISIRFSSDIQSGSTFFTDNNGLEMQKRTNLPNGRPGDFDGGVRIAGNFYPAVSRIAISDSSRQMVIASQSTHAGASLSNGQAELLLHRRCSRDDSRGMNEPLNDITTYVSKLKVNIDSFDYSSRFHQRATKLLSFTPTVMFGSSTSPAFKIPTFAPLKNLPENLHLVSLNPRSVASQEIVVRILHTFELGEHPSLSQPITFDLLNMFNGLKVTSAKEMTLTLLEQVNPQPQDFSRISISSMQIRSFLITVQPN